MATKGSASNWVDGGNSEIAAIKADMIRINARIVTVLDRTKKVKNGAENLAIRNFIDALPQDGTGSNRENLLVEDKADLLAEQNEMKGKLQQIVDLLDTLNWE